MSFFSHLVSILLLSLKIIKEVFVLNILKFINFLVNLHFLLENKVKLKSKTKDDNYDYDEASDDEYCNIYADKNTNYHDREKDKGNNIYLFSSYNLIYRLCIY